MIPTRPGRSSSVKHLKSHRITTPDRHNEKDRSRAILKKANKIPSGAGSLASYLSMNYSEYLLQQHTYDSLHPSMIAQANHIGENILREGTLLQILSSMFDHRLIANILLHTYRTLITAKTMLDTIDTILRNALQSSNTEVKIKTQYISAMQYFLYKWLSPPHMADFNDPPHFHALLQLVNLIQHWRQLQWTALNTNTSPCPDLDKSWLPITSRIEFALNLYSPENQEYVERPVDIENESENDGDIYLRVPDQVAGPDNQVYSAKPTSSLMKILAFDPKLIAQQLTYIDKEVYSHFLIHQVLEHAREDHKYPSPNIVETFNRLSRVVDFTVRCAARAGSGEDILYKWLLVTKELRTLKNFNCLMAVSQAMQKFKNEAAYADLFKSVVKQHNRAQFLLHEMERAVDVSGNYEYMRGLQDENMTLASTEPASSCSHGSIPFLAPYCYQFNLTANAGVPHMNKGHIYFLRKVQEFTILCNICCPQKCAKFYKHLQANADFISWYTNLPALVDDPSPIRTTSLLHNGDSSTSSQDGMSKSSLSVAAPRINSFSSNCLSKLSKDPAKTNAVKPPVIKNDDPLPFIMRVRLKESNLPFSGDPAVSYKSILVSPNDMMPSVIRNCLKKFNKDESEYCCYRLIQILSSPTKETMEIVLPELQNAYYAIAKNDLSGIFCELRQKPMQTKSVQSVKHRERRQHVHQHLRHSSSMLMPAQSSNIEHKLEYFLK